MNVKPMSKPKPKSKRVRGVADFTFGNFKVIIPPEEWENLVKTMIGKPVYDREEGMGPRKQIGTIISATFIADNIVEYEADIDQEAKV